jgi:acyl-coenzyme A thioesterase PaaI-like protein
LEPVKHKQTNLPKAPRLTAHPVPHGGYTTAVIYKLALTHFAHAHPKQYKSPASPISLQLSFLRRTASGPATFEVEDVKIGARTSTIHIKLLQPSEKKPGTTETMVAGYITVSPPDAEVGISASTGWKPQPPPPAGSRADGSIDFAALSRGSDGAWQKLTPPFPEFRKATAQIELYGPGDGASQQRRNGGMGIDQWARFRPGGDVNGRWTDAAVTYLIDMFPMALDGFDTMSATAVAKENGGAAEAMRAKFWYPTVTLNVDMKKHLPAEGVEWLYSRVVTKVVRDGRTDLEVTILDENGEVIALSTQVGLVVNASRNVGTRKLEKL